MTYDPFFYSKDTHGVTNKAGYTTNYFILSTIQPRKALKLIDNSCSKPYFYTDYKTSNMEQTAVLVRPFNLIQFLQGEVFHGHTYCEKTRNNIVLNALSADGYTDFCQYLKFMGLAGERDMMILSSLHYFYHDTNEFNRVKVLINLAKLNQIAHLDSFIRIIYSLLPERTSFVGCFHDNDRFCPEDQSQVRSKFRQAFNNKCGRVAGTKLSERTVTMVLEQNGFRVSDISRTNGTSFFCSEKTSIKV